MTKISLAFAVLALAGAAPAALADGSAEAGATKSAVCIACHGPGGNSVNPEWPNLAGQNATYIAEQLRQFRAGQRGTTPNAMVMTAQAMSLSDADIADLGAYFASQTPTGLEADPSYWKAGEALFRGGSHARGIPACMACHGPVGRGNPAAGYPALRAQHSVYTVAQLTAYAQGNRYDDATGAAHDTKNAHMMETIAKQLTPEDIRDLASYIQGMR
ncbi:MAG: cytochrome c [Steroidobacteraceae bacterium]